MRGAILHGFHFLGVLVLAAGAACGPKAGGGSNGTVDARPVDAALDATVVPDAARPDRSVQWQDAGDAGNVYVYDAAPSDGCPASMQNPCDSPLDPGCGSDEVCGNGLDDDCDGEVDEGCACTPGQVQECFLGPPNFVGAGACTMGTQTCIGSSEFGSWGPCQGGIWPTPEVCDDLDNDCNGCVDDGLCCAPPLSCPESSDIAEAQPFVPYELDGTQWYAGPASAWHWEVEGGPCDQLLGNTSFEIENADTSHPRIHFTLSGDYTVTMTVETPAGDTYTCTFVVHVAGPGLRVELCWEGTGSRDVDLHLLRSDLGAQWCDMDYDCHYANCKGSNWDLMGWNYSDSPLSACEGGPMGSYWQNRGSCANPRLDIDNIATPGIPENINVDAPRDGETFRIMVHYYSGSGEAHPLVNIYCDGYRIATFGQAPSVVTGFDRSMWDCGGATWRVADVTTHVQGGQTSCDVTALHPDGQNAGYRVLYDDTSY